MPCFQNLAFPSSYSSPTEDPLVFCLPIVWWGACPPRHTIEVFTTYLLHFFFLLLFILYFVLFLIRIFILTNTVRTKVAQAAKSELRFCFFVIFLILLSQLVSTRNEGLQT